MKNISWSENMNGYTEGSTLVLTTKPKEEVVTLDVAIEVQKAIDSLTDIIYNINDVYNYKAHKELYDVQVSLVLAKRALMRIIK